MFTRKFGVEVEFTGITRKQAAETAAAYLNTTAAYAGGYYEAYEVRAPDGRAWKFMYDGSIHCQRKENRRLISTDSQYSVEMVTPHPALPGGYRHPAGAGPAAEESRGLCQQFLRHPHPPGRGTAYRKEHPQLYQHHRQP